jgi:hypothetical protein
MTPVQGTDDGTTGYGVEGTSPSAKGVEGVVGGLPLEGIPLHGGRSASPVAGVVGYGNIVGLEPGGIVPPGSPRTCGVYGQSNSGGDGVYGVGTNGVHGSGDTGYGVLGENAAGTGVRGVIGPGSGHPQGAALAGVWGDSADGNGVLGSSAAWNGVEGDSWSPAHAGVAGQNNAGGPGVWGYSTGNAGQFEGNVAVTGNITVDGDILLQNPGQDCAEDFDAAEPDLSAGTVVVMCESRTGSVRSCDTEYATTVVGIISGAGGLRPAITLGRRTSAGPTIPIALMGTVYCKVDATYSPIGVGDLLTTSKTSGHAMRATDPGRAFGSVIGKALAGLAQGQGMIPVLVALQ